MFVIVTIAERDEFIEAFRQICPDSSVSEVAALFDRTDQDGNRSISFIEFLAATLDPKDLEMHEIKQVNILKQCYFYTNVHQCKYIIIFCVLFIILLGLSVT